MTKPAELSRQEKKDGLIYGAIAGIISVILSVASIYYTRSADNYSTLFVVGTTLKIFSTVLVPVILVYFLRKKNGQDWTFSHALKSIYILLASSIIIASLGTRIYQKSMDKIVLEESYHNLMNLKIVDMEEKEAPTSEIDRQMEMIEQEKEFALTDLSFRTLVAPVFIELLIGFVFAMMLAALFRSNKA